MCHRTPIPIYSGSALFRWLDKQLNACSTTVRRFKLNRLYRHTPRMRALSALGPIGIGGSLAAPPLPHHRTYGSVSGGSLD
jgi:hypothetical protein